MLQLKKIIIFKGKIKGTNGDFRLHIRHIFFSMTPHDVVGLVLPTVWRPYGSLSFKISMNIEQCLISYSLLDSVKRAAFVAVLGA
jgi:hypothetical protein